MFSGNEGNITTENTNELRKPGNLRASTELMLRKMRSVRQMEITSVFTHCLAFRASHNSDGQVPD